MSLIGWLKSLFKVAEAPKIEEEVGEKVRTKDCKGRFVADDPTTPDVNEAWTVKKKQKNYTAKKKKEKKKTSPKKKKAKK